MRLKPITLRNVPPEVARAIRRRARNAGVSLNKAVIGLLEEVLGNQTSSVVQADRNDLDALAGRWSSTEAKTFDATLARQREVDPELWK